MRCKDGVRIKCIASPAKYSVLREALRSQLVHMSHIITVQTIYLRISDACVQLEQDRRAPSAARAPFREPVAL